MTIISFGLEWDSLSIAKQISKAFQERNFTTKKGKPLGSTMTFGMSDDGKTAFIIDGFDNKNLFGISVTISNERKEIQIIGGPFNEVASMKAKYNQDFTDLSVASKFLEQILNDYDRSFKK